MLPFWPRITYRRIAPALYAGLMWGIIVCFLNVLYQHPPFTREQIRQFLRRLQEVSSMRQYKGSVTIGNVTYFDCPELAVTFIEEEIGRLWKPAIDVIRHDEGVHDRGFRYVTYQVTSRRRFDPDVELVAGYLDTLAHHVFADLRGQDASRWPVKTLRRAGECENREE